MPKKLKIHLIDSDQILEIDEEVTVNCDAVKHPFPGAIEAYYDDPKMCARCLELHWELNRKYVYALQAMTEIEGLTSV